MLHGRTHRFGLMLTFEWDIRKSRNNLRRHGVSFDEAMTCFSDVYSQTIHDPDHSIDEDRYVLLGMSIRGRLLVVVHAERDDTIRLISARPANRRERTRYVQMQ